MADDDAAETSTGLEQQMKQAVAERRVFEQTSAAKQILEQQELVQESIMEGLESGKEGISAQIQSRIERLDELHAAVLEDQSAVTRKHLFVLCLEEHKVLQDILESCSSAGKAAGVVLHFVLKSAGLK